MTKKERERVKNFLKNEEEKCDFTYLYLIGRIHYHAAIARGLPVRDIACSELETTRRNRPENFDNFMSFINGIEHDEKMKKHTNVIPLDKTKRRLQGKS
jgi:hypothetical protein